MRPRIVLACCLAAALAAAALAIAWAARWTAPEDAAAVVNPVLADEASRGRGRDLYARHCQSCHGDRGDGRGPVATRLGFEAGDLTDGARMAQETDGSLFWKIAMGRDPMPSFRKDKKISDRAIWDLVNFIRTFAPPPPGHRNREAPRR